MFNVFRCWGSDWAIMGPPFTSPSVQGDTRMGKPWRVGLNTCFFFPFYIWTGFFPTFLFPKQFIQNKKKKKSLDKTIHDGSSFSLEVAFLAATSGITERDDGRESFPFSKVYWTVAILCLLCPILLLDSRRFSFSLVFSARGFRFHVFTFLHSHSGEEEERKKNATDPS